jgi:hypothetical protein
MPDEYIVDTTGGGIKVVIPDYPSKYDKVQRAKRFASNLRLVSIPSTLLKITQMQEQLKYLQLWRGGAPISFATVAKKLDIENYGDVAGVTEREKWMNEQIDNLKFKIAASMLAAQLGIPALPQQGGGAPAPQQAGAGSGQGPHEGGRKPSGNAPPKLVQKGASTWQPRTTVTESG